MTDISGRLRRAQSVYDASYPPAVFAPDPQINTLAPNTVSAAAGPTTITVNGTDFEATSVVEVDGTAQATTFVSPTVLTISYDPTVAGTDQFTVRNTSGKESNSVPFVVGALAGTQAATSKRRAREPVEPAPEPEPEDTTPESTEPTEAERETGPLI